jgi:hypothetical protein
LWECEVFLVFLGVLMAFDAETGELGKFLGLGDNLANDV